MTIGEALERQYIVGQLIHKTPTSLGAVPAGTVVASRKDEIIAAYSPITGTFIKPAVAVQMGLLSRDQKAYYDPVADERMTVEEC